MKIIKVSQESKSDGFYEEYPLDDEETSRLHKMLYAEVAKKQERIKLQEKNTHKKQVIR